MDINSMKNMIILKDLPSNMIEEAFIVFKDNVKIHKTEKIENGKKVNKEEKENSKDYILKEAEMIIKDYISKIEKKEYEIGNGNEKLKQKYKRLKALTTLLAMFSFFSTIAILLK